MSYLQDRIKLSKKSKILNREYTTKHIPNKNELKCLHKIQSKTRLTEDEIRAIKKYRIMLSTAQKEGTKSTKSRYEKFLNSEIKKITKELKLAKEHPLVIAEFKRRVEDNFYLKMKFKYTFY